MSVPFDTIEKNIKYVFSVFLVSPGHLGTIQYLIPGWMTIVKLLKHVKNWQSPSRDPWSNCLINSRETTKGQINNYSGRQKDNSKTICRPLGYYCHTPVYYILYYYKILSCNARCNVNGNMFAKIISCNGTLLSRITRRATRVQPPVSSLNPAIHNAYHTSLHPLSLLEPRHPSLELVKIFSFILICLFSLSHLLLSSLSLSLHFYLSSFSSLSLFIFNSLFTYRNGSRKSYQSVHLAVSKPDDFFPCCVK